MKHTTSMIYRPTEESRELYLVATNESTLYPMIQAIEANLEKKIKKGIYDSEKAIEAFYHVMDQASKKYMHDFGYMFTVTERWTAAQDMRDSFEEETRLQGVKI